MDKNKLIKFLILNTIVTICFSLARPITPALLQDKGSVDSLNGILFSLMSLGMVIASPLWGKYIEKIGPKRVMIFSPLIYGLTQLMLGFSPGAIGMSLASLLSGLFSSGWVVIGYIYINKYSDETSKTKYFGYILVTVSLAGIIGQLLSGFIGTYIDIYTIFIIQFIAILISVLLIYFLIEEYTISNKSEDEIEHEREIIAQKEYYSQGGDTALMTIQELDEEKNFFIHFKILYKEGMLYLLIILLFFSLARSSYISQVGYFVSDYLNKGTLAVGFVNAYTNTIMLIANYFLVSRLEIKFGALRFLRIQFIFGIIGITILYFVTSFWALIPITIYLLGIVMGRPVIQKIILARTSLGSSEALGYANSANALGLVLGSFISGFIYQIHPKNVIIFILLTLLLGVVFLLFTTRILKEKKRRRLLREAKEQTS